MRAQRSVDRGRAGRAIEPRLADLRAAAGRYPDDQRLRRLVAELRANSDRFVELWDSGAVGRHEAARKTIDHPQVGPLTLDCDVLTVAGSDLRIMIYRADPGTEDAERLALLTVLAPSADTPAGDHEPEGDRCRELALRIDRPELAPLIDRTAASGDQSA